MESLYSQCGGLNAHKSIPHHSVHAESIFLSVLYFLEEVKHSAVWLSRHGSSRFSAVVCLKTCRVIKQMSPIALTRKEKRLFVSEAEKLHRFVLKMVFKLLFIFLA